MRIQFVSMEYLWISSWTRFIEECCAITRSWGFSHSSTLYTERQTKSDFSTLMTSTSQHITPLLTMLMSLSVFDTSNVDVSAAAVTVPDQLCRLYAQINWNYLNHYHHFTWMNEWISIVRLFSQWHNIIVHKLTQTLTHTK